LISFSTSISTPATVDNTELIQPVDGRAPVRSAISIAVRATGMCWNTSRYTASACRFGPYTAAAPIPVGAAAVVVAPHPQHRRWSRCSITVGVMVGMSWTWRRTTPAGCAAARSLPQPPQASAHDRQSRPDR
jgi:hypothetical protein